MPIEGLTQEQSDFVERFLNAPKLSDLKTLKQRRVEAKEDFRLFNAEHDLLRAQIEAVEDSALRSRLLAELANAQKIIERDPEKLDFAGGHAQLAEVAQQAQTHAAKAEANRAYSDITKRMEELEKGRPSETAGDPDLQRDIDLTWAFAKAQLQSGVASGEAADFRAASDAMKRLDLMIDQAELALTNPFAGPAPDDYEAGNAHRLLADVHDALMVLREDLRAQFGEGKVPMSLLMECTAVQNKLETAQSAAPSELAALASDAEAALRAARSKADDMISLARIWDRDHEAFLTRYQVMKDHPKKSNAEFVKPEFDGVRALYNDARETAASHEYAEASRKIELARNALRDALDFADDFARYSNRHAECAALLKRLPDPASYTNAELHKDHEDAVGLLTQAEGAHAAGQMSGALSTLNQIPDAVTDVLTRYRRIVTFEKQIADWEAQRQTLEDGMAPDARALISNELEEIETGVRTAQAEADRGDFKGAVARMRVHSAAAKDLKSHAALVTAYLAERDAFAARLQEARLADRPKCRVAIEDYFQNLLADDAKRASAEAVGDFSMAYEMCVVRAGEHDDMMRKVDQAEDYFRQKDEFDTALNALTAHKTPEVEAAKVRARAARDQAVAASVRGNWIMATSLLQSATFDLNDAVNDAELQALIGSAEDGPSPIALTSPSGFEGAYGAFRKALEKVEAVDSGNHYSDKLAAADAQAKSAEGLAANDLDAAQNALNAATADVEAVAQAATAAATYDKRREAAAKVVAEASAANRDGVIDAEIAGMEEEMARAAQAADAPEPDFIAAVKHLSDAEENARLALASAALYASTVLPARQRSEALLVLIDAPAAAPYFESQRTALRDAIAALDQAFDQRDLAETQQQADACLAIEQDCRDQYAAFSATQAFIDQNLQGDDGAEMTHPATSAEAARINDLSQTMEAQRLNGDFMGARNTAAEIKWLMLAAREKAVKFDRYLDVKLRAERGLRGLEERALPDTGKMQETVANLRATFNTAVEKEKKQDYEGAASALEGFLPACTEVAADVDAYDLYLVQSAKAQKVLEELRKNDAPEIAPLLARMEETNTASERAAAALDFKGATELCDDLIAQAGAVQTAAHGIESLEGTEGDTDLLQEIAQAEAVLDGASRAPSALYVRELLADGRSALAAARQKSAEDQTAAQQDLNIGRDRCKEILSLLAQFDQINATAQKVREMGVELLQNHPLRAEAGQAEYMAEKITQHLQALDDVMRAARKEPNNKAQARDLANSTLTALRDLRGKLDAQLAYVQTLRPIEAVLNNLENGGERKAVKDDIASVRKMLKYADGYATDGNHEAARKELTAAKDALDAAALRAKLGSGEALSAEDFRAILDAPDGPYQLERALEQLPAAERAAALAAAFEARFGCELPRPAPEEESSIGRVLSEDDNQLPTDISKLFETMGRLPESDPLEDPSMLTAVDADDVPAYKPVMMRESAEDHSSRYSIAFEHELGTMHEGFIPKPGEERTQRSWSVLREIGFVINDKLHYMTKHGERLGGWKVYGSDVNEPARAIAGKYDFDAGYVAQYMVSPQGKDLPIPEPVGCTFDEWCARMEECRRFVDRARVGNSPWSSAAIADECAIGEYTYVESTERNWARYLTSRRKLGVSGYQFRGPAEWFSELYAAFHSGRLPDNHPHKDDVEFV